MSNPEPVEGTFSTSTPPPQWLWYPYGKGRNGDPPLITAWVAHRHLGPLRRFLAWLLLGSVWERIEP